METLEALRREMSLPDTQPGATRRNVFVTGADLQALVGREFEVQGVRFQGTEHCAPCQWMDYSIGSGAEKWLQGRGGLRARILTDGMLRCEA